MISSIRYALSFLTILPLGKKETNPGKLAGSSAWFPLVGYLLGAVYFGIAKIFSGRLAEPLISFLVLFLMIVLTGGLHLDGLADWADGLGGKDREDRLRIMKDPHKGSFGVSAIILDLLGKFLAIYFLISQKQFIPIFLASGLARFNLTLLIYTIPYARTRGGTGGVFARHKKFWHLALALGTALVPLIYFNQIIIWLALALSLSIALVFRILALRFLGGFTGDLLGASAEFAELALLFFFACLNP